MNRDTPQPENPNISEVDERTDKERACYNRLIALAAGTIGVTAIVSCSPNSKEPTPTPDEVPTVTIITSEPPTLSPKPTPTPLPPIPVAPLSPEHER